MLHKPSKMCKNELVRKLEILNKVFCRKRAGKKAAIQGEKLRFFRKLGG